MSCLCINLKVTWCEWPTHVHTHTQIHALFSCRKNQPWSQRAGHKTSPDCLLFMRLLCYGIKRRYFNSIFLPSAYNKKTNAQLITPPSSKNLTACFHWALCDSMLGLCSVSEHFKRENMFIMTRSQRSRRHNKECFRWMQIERKRPGSNANHVSSAYNNKDSSWYTNLLFKRRKRKKSQQGYTNLTSRSV